MDVEAVTSVIGIVLSAAAFLIGRLSAAKDSGSKDGTILTEIGYLKSGIDDVKHKIDSIDRRYYELAGRVTKLEEQVHIYHTVQ
nr:hypothetical protein [Clostridia bacterium]